MAITDATKPVSQGTNQDPYSQQAAQQSGGPTGPNGSNSTSQAGGPAQPPPTGTYGGVNVANPPGWGYAVGVNPGGGWSASDSPQNAPGAAPAPAPTSMPRAQADAAGGAPQGWWFDGSNWNAPAGGGAPTAQPANSAPYNPTSPGYPVPPLDPMISQPVGAQSLPPQYNPGQYAQVTPNTPGPGSSLGALAANLATVGPDQTTTNNGLASAFSNMQNAMAMNNPQQFVGGLEEKQKETLNALRQQQLDQLHTGAAMRGTLGGGATQGVENQIGDQFNSNLTASYRDIEQKAQQQAIDNYLAGGSAIGGLTLGAGALNNATQAQRFNQASGLQAQNASQANTADTQALARLQALAGINLNTDQLGLARTLGMGNLNLGQQGTTNTLELGKGQQGLTAQQIANQNRQFDASLAQQNAQFGQSMDWQQQQAFFNAIMNNLS